MRVSEYGSQRVRPREFWTAVAAVALVSAVLVGVGLFTMGKGRFPNVFSAFGAAIIALGWAATLWGLVRRGRKHFSLLYLLFFVGYSLFFGEQLIPCFAGGKIGKSEAASFIGVLLILPFILSPYVDFKKRRLTS